MAARQYFVPYAPYSPSMEYLPPINSPEAKFQAQPIFIKPKSTTTSVRASATKPEIVRISSSTNSTRRSSTIANTDQRRPQCATSQARAARWASAVPPTSPARSRPAASGLLVAPHRRQVEPFMRRYEILRHVAADRVDHADIEKLVGGTAPSRDFRFHDNAKFTARHVPNSPSSPPPAWRRGSNGQLSRKLNGWFAATLCHGPLPRQIRQCFQ